MYYLCTVVKAGEVIKCIHTIIVVGVITKGLRKGEKDDQADVFQQNPEKTDTGVHLLKVDQAVEGRTNGRGSEKQEGR